MTRKQTTGQTAGEEREPQQAEGRVEATPGVSTPEPDNQSGGFRTVEPDSNREARQEAEQDVRETPDTGPDAGPAVPSAADEDPTGQGKLEPGTPLGAAGPGFGDTRGPAGVDPNQAAADTDVTLAFPAVTGDGPGDGDTTGERDPGQ